MLSMRDCVDMCDLDDEEVEAIAEHEHVPQIVACEIACVLMQSNDGVDLVHHFMEENRDRAAAKGQRNAAAHWRDVLHRFDRSHPH